MTLTEVRKKAKELGITGISRKNKEDLLFEITTIETIECESKEDQKKTVVELTIDEQLSELDKLEKSHVEGIKECQEKKKELLSKKTSIHIPIHVLLKEQKLSNENQRKSRALEQLKVIDFINK